jgi:hypothetical protein
MEYINTSKLRAKNADFLNTVAVVTIDGRPELPNHRVPWTRYL